MREASGGAQDHSDSERRMRGLHPDSWPSTRRHCSVCTGFLERSGFAEQGADSRRTPIQGGLLGNKVRRDRAGECDLALSGLYLAHPQGELVGSCFGRRKEALSARSTAPI